MSLSIVRCTDPIVERIYSSGLIPLGAAGSVPLNVYVPREQGDYLYSLVRHYSFDLTVEIGLANGLSALFIAAAHRDNGRNGRHIAVDPFQYSDWNGVGMGLLRHAGLSDRVRLVELPSHQGLPDLEREGVRAGLVFIDGAHLTDYAFADFLGADRILDIGGLLAFDDSDWAAVRPVIRYAISNREYQPAHPEIVIEPPPGTPSMPLKMLRRVGRKVESIGKHIKADALWSSEELGISGRCVVLRKTSEDRRNSQSQDSHREF